MTDEQTPAPAEADSATTTAPEGETTTEAIDWERRAHDHQAAFTKASQELAERKQWEERVRTDPDEQRKFLAEELGYDIEDDSPDPFDDDPVSALEQRLARIEAKEQQAAAQAEHDGQLEAAEAHFNGAFQTLGDAWGEPLINEEQDAVIGLALTMPPGDDGMPPAEKAIESLKAIIDRHVERAKAKWEADNAPKRRPSHTFTPGGVAGEDKPDRSTHEGRVAHMLNKLSDTA